MGRKEDDADRLRGLGDIDMNGEHREQRTGDREAVNRADRLQLMTRLDRAAHGQQAEDQEHRARCQQEAG